MKESKTQKCWDIGKRFPIHVYNLQGTKKEIPSVGNFNFNLVETVSLTQYPLAISLATGISLHKIVFQRIKQVPAFKFLRVCAHSLKKKIPPVFTVCKYL